MPVTWAKSGVTRQINIAKASTVNCSGRQIQLLLSCILISSFIFRAWTATPRAQGDNGETFYPEFVICSGYLRIVLETEQGLVAGKLVDGRDFGIADSARTPEPRAQSSEPRSYSPASARSPSFLSRLPRGLLGRRCGDARSPACPTTACLGPAPARLSPCHL